MLPGLMQDRPLNIIDILRFAARAHSGRAIVSKNVDEPVWRYDYAGALRRVAQAAHALARLGLRSGDRVSSLAWNTHRHFELFYAVPGVGAVPSSGEIPALRNALRPAASSVMRSAA